mgnify:CR=1 FL=1
MKILVLNSGSSSVKYRFFEMRDERCLAWGMVERIGTRGALLKHNRYDGDAFKMAGDIPDHSAAIEQILAVLLSEEHGVIKGRGDIDAVGHRVVHGGEKFAASVLITPEVMEQIHDCIELAPLHNPHNIKGITACRALLKDKPQAAVFDTAFHQRMPDHAYNYGLPHVLYRRYGIRRYGFHGTSHRYVSERAAALMERPIEDIKLVTCHLGNGCSAAAVDGGVSVDTSMGFTPTEGLLMGTRTGDLDPAALRKVERRITYHDSCRLARGEGMTEEPRRILEWCGASIEEPAQSRQEALCCGAGGGIRSVYRDLSLEIAAAALAGMPAETVVSACPFCTFNLSFASRKKGLDKRVIYLSQVVLDSLDE